MKNIISLFVALHLVFTLQAQSFPKNSAGDIEYTGVVTTEGYSKNDLYVQIRAWITKNFKDGNEVIQMDDKEDGRIIAKGISKLDRYQYFGWINYTIDIQVKDGRYKYTISNVRHELPLDATIYTPGTFTAEKAGGGLHTMGNPRWLKIKQESSSKLKRLEQKLQTIITGEKEKEEEW